MIDETPGESADDDLVIALTPPQIGALLAFVIAIVLVFRAVRRND